MKRARVGWIGGIVAVLFLGGVAFAYVSWSRSSRAESSGEWVTEAVDRGTIATTVTATGTVDPVTTVQVGTYVSGPILEIDVDFNAVVTKGQRVAKIDPRPFQTKVRQAEANVATAQARVAKAVANLGLKRRSLERARQLVSGDFVAKSDLDVAESEHQQAVADLALEQASVQQAEAALEESRINLGYTDIRSPVDGVVISRNIDVGQTVAASFQTPTLFVIAHDLTQMQVDGHVSESDIGTVREGQRSEFSVDAYPGRRFEGLVAQVRNAATAVQNVVTYDVVIGVDNPDLALKPGMTATVTIVTAQRDDVARVPVRALRFKPEAEAEGAPKASALWVVERGRLRRVEVEIGLANDRYAELVRGEPAPGTPVVVASQRPAKAAEEPTRLPFTPQRPRSR